MPDSGDVTRPAWSWAADSGNVRLRFLGRNAPRRAEDLRHHLEPRPDALGWLRQVHSNRVLEARPGLAGEGDALFTSRENLALTIATADCVPVLLAAGELIAAAHAGWRGLVQGVLSATLSRLTVAPSAVEAWIGPAIGPCCYQVGADVAARLEAVGDAGAVATRPGRNPHVDLHAIALHQLRALGIETIHRIDLCTKCNPDLLWSYRGEGERAERNWAVIWRGEM